MDIDREENDKTFVFVCPAFVTLNIKFIIKKEVLLLKWTKTNSNLRVNINITQKLIWSPTPSITLGYRPGLDLFVLKDDFLKFFLYC